MSLSSLSDADFLKLQQRICAFEGFRARIYRDPRGILTWGYGTNLESRTLTLEEGLVFLRNDLLAIEEELIKNVPHFESLSPLRKIALFDMAYNMGIHKMLEFSRMLGALRDNNYPLAGAQMMDSSWGRDKLSYHRALADATLMETDNL